MIDTRLSGSNDHDSWSPLIRFDSKVRWVLWLSLLLIILTLLFKIHGSSVHSWDQFIGNSGEKSSGLLLGTPKNIRSDEWGTYTPNTLSQANKGFPLENISIGGGKAPLFINSPVKHYTSIFRPQFWGFFFLDIERGFSFFWIFKTFGLFISAFLMFLLITSNRFWLSLLGATWIYLSSFVQWWFSIPFLPGMIASFNIIFIALVYLLFSKRKSVIIASAILFIVFTINFAMYFYLPFLIPLFYLLVFMLIGYFIGNFNRELLFSRFKFRLFSFILSIVSILAILAALYIETKETIALMANTIHPGIRSFQFGGFNWVQYFSGFFDMFYRESQYPKIWLNVCESSRFILFFPFLLFYFVFVAAIKKKFDFLKNYILEIALFLYLGLLSLWLLWGLPEFIAKITMFNKVHTRGYDGVGIAGIILTISFLSKKMDIKGFSWKQHAIFLLPVFLLLGLYGLLLIRLDPFFTWPKVAIVTVLFTIMTGLLINKRAMLFGILLLLVLSPNLMVNPVASGLSPVLDTNLARVCSDIAQADKDAKWVVFGDMWLPMYLNASGLDVINGKIFPPRLDLLKVLDPDMAYNKVHNRAAFVKFEASKSGFNNKSKQDSVQFKLDGRHFIYKVIIDPSSEKFESLGVRYFVFTNPPSREIHDKLFPIKRVNRFWICQYRRNNDVAESERSFRRVNGYDDSIELSELKQRNIDPIGFIESINGSDMHHRTALDISANNRWIDLKGYAADAVGRDLAGGVYIEIAGKLYPAVYGLKRPDVIGHGIRFPTTKQTFGFSASIPMADVGDGRHPVSLVIQSNDKTQYDRSHQKLHLIIGDKAGIEPRMPTLDEMVLDPMPTQAQIEFLNGVNLYSNKQAQVLQKNVPYIELSGYAVDKRILGPAAAVLIDINGKLYTAQYGFVRRDVPKNLKLPMSTVNSGFKIRIPRGEFTLGRYTISIKVVSQDRTRYYQTAQRVRFEIR